MLLERKSAAAGVEVSTAASRPARVRPDDVENRAQCNPASMATLPHCHGLLGMPSSGMMLSLMLRRIHRVATELTRPTIGTRQLISDVTVKGVELQDCQTIRAASVTWSCCVRHAGRNSIRVVRVSYLLGLNSGESVSLSPE